MKLLAGYAPAMLPAWAGWRLRIPGGPIGGQHHGFPAPDETVEYMGWPAGPHEMIRPMDNPAGLGLYPWQPWDPDWHGVPLMEGQTVSDYVYRSPGEVRPRANASGGVNVVAASQLARSAGYAVAPGNYRALGAIMPGSLMPTDPIYHAGGGGAPFYPHPICPAWGCGPPPWMHPMAATLPSCPTSDPLGANQACGAGMNDPCPPCVPLPVSPSPAPVVTQPPPPVSPQPGPVVGIGPGGSSGCAFGQYRDAAGNCTSDWRNPYPMYLPQDNAAQPSPVIPANTCPTGYSVDANGNCVAPGTCPAGDSVDASGNCIPPGAATGITGWLSSSSSIAGLSLPNWGWAVGAFVLVRMMGGRGGRR